MNKNEQIRQFKKDSRPIIRSFALMLECDFGHTLCLPLSDLLRDFRTECKQANETQVENIYKALLYQFSLATALFNLMHDNIDQAIANLKLSAKEGNIPAGIALWVVDKKLNSKHLADTEINSVVLEIIGTNKCHVAFTPPLTSEPCENPKLWQGILEKLQYAHDVGIYVRAVLNLTLGNHFNALSDMIQFTEETGRLSGEVIALQIWNGYFEEAKQSLLALSNDHDGDSWGRDYANALEAYLSHASMR